MSFHCSYLKDEDSKYCARKAITILLKKETANEKLSQFHALCLFSREILFNGPSSFPLLRSSPLLCSLDSPMVCIDYMSLTASPLLFPNNFDLAGKTTIFLS